MHQPSRPHAPSPHLGLALAAALGLVAPALALAAEPGCPEGMRALAGGRFTLADGSAAAEVGAMCLDVFEVTAAAYAACVARGACPEAGLRCGKAATYGDPARADHPVNCVSWEEADRYCRAQGKRLPTEAEWEWAARGRQRALTYPWGTAPPASRACWDGPGSTLGKGGRNETCAVGAFPAGDSPDGLHDLGGNVREWTASRIGKDRVVRGGSWGDSLPDFLAAGFRGMNKVDERFEITGFRCAATPGLLAEARPAARDLPPAPPRSTASAAPAAPARGGPRLDVEIGEIRIEPRAGRP
jgi:sulfatase-modifying factor enzyme 1